MGMVWRMRVLKVDWCAVGDRLLNGSRSMLQEQPAFMVVAPDDDSLVFQFHKPPHHSHVCRP